VFLAIKKWLSNFSIDCFQQKSPITLTKIMYDYNKALCFCGSKNLIKQQNILLLIDLHQTD
jgi:hypothetical protein